jgi:ABC-type lipoprotein release transport system permease subunit
MQRYLVAPGRREFAISPGVTTFSAFTALVLLVLAASVGPAREARRTQPAPLLRED